MARQTVGLVIQNIGVESETIAYLKGINPLEAIVINNPAFAVKVATELPNTLVWHRYHSDNEDHIWRGGISKIKDMIKSFHSDKLSSRSNIGLYVSNEIKVGKNELPAAIKFHVDFAEEVKGTFPLLLWNGGVGNYGNWALDDGYFDSLFAVSHKYPGRVKIGLHEYAGPLPWLGSAGRSETEHFDHEKAREKPSPWDVQVVGVVKRTNWLVGKIWEYVDRARSKGYDKARFTVSEGGPDDITKYRETIDLYEKIGQKYGQWGEVNGKRVWLKMPQPHYEFGGWNTYKFYYEKVFGGVFKDHVHERAIMEIIKWYAFIYADYEFIFDGGKVKTRDFKIAWRMFNERGGKIDDVKPIATNDPTIVFTAWLHSPNKDDWDVKKGGSLHRFPFVYTLWGNWTKEIEGSTEPQTPTQPQFPPFPANDIPGWEDAVLRVEVGLPYANIRSTPTIADNDIGDVQDGTKLRYNPKETFKGLGEWVPVILKSGLEGWISLNTASFEEPGTVPQVPVPNYLLLTPLEAKEVADLEGEIVDFVRVVSDAHAKIAERHAKIFQIFNSAHERNKEIYL